MPRRHLRPAHALRLLWPFAACLACTSPSGGGGGGYYGGGGGYPADTNTAGGGGSEWRPGRGAGAGQAPGLDNTAGGEIAKSEVMSQLFKEAALECAADMVQLEAKAAADCKASIAHQASVYWSVPHFKKILLTDARFPGLDWPPVISTPPTMSFGDHNIDTFTCVSNPIGGADMNAFAMQDGVWLVEPLLNAFAESAALWDLARVSAPGGQLDSEAKDKLMKAIIAIFLTHQAGEGWQIVSQDDTYTRFDVSDFAKEVYFGGVAFVLYHELAHANLSHGLIQCALGKGVLGLLKRRGRTLTKEQEQELIVEMQKISRSTETQADIYALTMLRSIGFGVEAPAIFVLGVAGIKAKACADKGHTGQQLEDCTLGKGQILSHPPLDERSLLIQKILKDGEDLTWMLQPTAITQVRQKSCGNGICEANESAKVCPQDCSGRSKVCGNGACETGENKANCPKDCGAKEPVCGDGVCDLGEDCKADCPRAQPKCGNGICDPGEVVQTCEIDCADWTCLENCGNYTPEAKCQCDDGCKEYGDCCPDYEANCGG